jgi:hypothetical protein
MKKLLCVVSVLIMSLVVVGCGHWKHLLLLLCKQRAGLSIALTH